LRRRDFAGCAMDLAEGLTRRSGARNKTRKPGLIEDALTTR
jgi:hypothetical protein